MAAQKKQHSNKGKTSNVNHNTKINSKKTTAGSNTKHRQNARRRPKVGEAERQRNELYMAIPLCLIAGVVPLIIFLRKVVLNDPGNLYWDGKDTHFDMFSYYKMVFLLLFTFVGVAAYIYLHRENPFEKARYKYYIPVGAFSLFALLSAFLSEYRQVAFFGFLERYEGTFVLLAYSVILFLAMNVFRGEKTIRILFGFILSSAAIISVIGIFQYFGMDLFQTGFFLRMITPPSLKELGGQLVSKVNPKTIYSTLYNPNYVGSYMAMVIPMIIVLIIWAKKLSHKLLLGALLALAVINLIGCDSRAGLVGTVFTVFVLMVVYRRKILKHKWIALAVVLAAAVGLWAFNFATSGSLFNRIERMLTLEGKEDNDEAIAALHRTLAGINDIRLDDKKAEIVTEKGTIKITLNNGALGVTDGNDEDLTAEFEDNIVRITDERFSNVKLSIKADEGVMLVYYNDYELMNIILTQEGLKSTSNRWMTYRNGREIEAFGFEGMETLGSNRGYIWSRTLPLLKDTIFVGKGPDTFAIYFPQYDFLNKLKYYQLGNMFVDKAHNMYLQTALQTGILSLLAMLVLFGMYVVSSIKVYWKEDFTSYLPVAGVACFAAFCGYIVAGFMNDSNVSVSPVFWVLLGLGIGINLMLRKEKEKKAAEIKK